MKDKRMVLSYVELKDFSEIDKEHVCSPLCTLPCRKNKSEDDEEENAEQDSETVGEAVGETVGDADESSNSSSACTEQSTPEKIEEVIEVTDSAVEVQGVSFTVERHPRIGKQCVIMPLPKIQDSTLKVKKQVNEMITSLSNDYVGEAETEAEGTEHVKELDSCYSMLAEPEKKLLLCVKRDMERLNLTSKLKVAFPLHNNNNNSNNSVNGGVTNNNDDDDNNANASDMVPDKNSMKKVGSPDDVKVYQMIVTTANDRTKQSKKLSLDNNEAKTKDSDASSSIKSNETDVTFHPGMYEDVAKKFGIILCDFYMNDMKQMPRESRQWMRKSEKMKIAPVHMYPLMSINKVQWNPNCRSFLWLAAGYQCGLVRVPCVSGMHTREVERILQQAASQVAAQNTV